jgi:hypothetical protein
VIRHSCPLRESCEEVRIRGYAKARELIFESIRRIMDGEVPIGNLAVPYAAEYMAQKILEGIKTSESEIFAHDWMKKRADAAP